MQSRRVSPVDNSRNEEEGGGKKKGRGEKEGKKEKKKSLDHGVKGLRAAYFMRLRRTY